MKRLWVKLLPYLLILFGFLVLSITNIGLVAGVIIMIGILMLLERIWPEKWGD